MKSNEFLTPKCVRLWHRKRNHSYYCTKRPIVFSVQDCTQSSLCSSRNDLFVVVGMIVFAVPQPRRDGANETVDSSIAFSASSSEIDD